MSAIRATGQGQMPRLEFMLGTGFGAALAFVGDIDGDGAQELAVGARADSSSGPTHGAAWILFLNKDGAIKRFSEISERTGLAFPLNEGAFFGSSVTPLGDLDGDSIPDLLVGAPGWNRRSGGLWVLFLDRNGHATRSVEIVGNVALKELSLGEGSGIGKSSCCLGDLDGDGTVEIAVGQQAGFSHEKERIVLILSIRPDGQVERAKTIHDQRDGFSSDYSWLGDALVRIDDMDDDGVPELAIGDPYDEDGGEVRGAVWIVWLNRDGSIKKQRKISDWAGGFEGRLKDWSEFGSALASPGDMDGDGIPELLVGSDEGVWTVFLQADGTVAEQVFFGNGQGGFTDTGSLGRSLAVCRSASNVLLASGGNMDETNEAVVWMLRLDPKGTVKSR